MGDTESIQKPRRTPAAATLACAAVVTGLAARTRRTRSAGPVGSGGSGSDPGPDARTAGLAGPDGPECLSAVVAAEIAGTPLAGCPSDALDPRDATAIRATVGLIADRRAPSLNIISDSSPRSARAAAVATEVARARGLPLTDAPQLEGSVLMVAGWEVGGRRLIDEALGLSVVFGTYTAPWLATQSVLGRQTGAVTTLDFDPRDVPAQRYLVGLRSAGMVELAAPSGFRAWDPEPSGTAPRVFSAAQVSVMPADIGGSDHHRSMDRWLPGGTFTPVTPPLRG